jgi:hypothetical protein
MLEALIHQGGGRWIVDAKAASEPELIAALGLAHGCTYKSVHPNDILKKWTDRGWIKCVEIYETHHGFHRQLFLKKSVGGKLV